MTKTTQASEVAIERAAPEDAEAIMTLKRAAWLAAYTSVEYGVTTADIEKKFPLESMSEAIKNWQTGIASESRQNLRATFVAKLDGKVVGYTSPAVGDDQRRVGALYVSPEFQGRGIGAKLLDTAIDWHGHSGDIFLHVVSFNQPAIDFYEHRGFKKTGAEFVEEVDETGARLLPEIEMVLPARTKSV